MLSVAKLAAGQEAYYEQQVASGLDDYLAGRGESPGLWVGSGAEALGLDGVVGDGELGVLLGGLSPADGARLRAPAPARTITVRELDVATGVWRDEPKTLAPVAGFDLVFSCPKSVSLLHALTDDEGVRRTISEAHEAAWRAAIGYLEREACVVRRGRGGAIREHGGGFVAAAFRHRTSRAQDPHLHTHVIVANLAQGADGRWRALDGEAILRTYRLAAGYLYEAHLRAELSRALGVRWREPVKGMAEIEGVPEEAIRAFSTRRQSLVEHMEAMGTSGFAAARVAALATRERKEHVRPARTSARRGSPAPRRWASEQTSSEASSGASRRSGSRRRSRPPRLRPTSSPPTRRPSRRPEIVCAVAGAAARGSDGRGGSRGRRARQRGARRDPGRRRLGARPTDALHRHEPARPRARGARPGPRRPRRRRPVRLQGRDRRGGGECPGPAVGRAARAGGDRRPLARPGRLRGGRRRRRQDDGATGSRRGPDALGRSGARRRAERARRRRAGAGDRDRGRQRFTRCWPRPGARAACRGDASS